MPACYEVSELNCGWLRRNPADVLLGRNIRFHRLDRGVSQSELANRANLSVGAKYEIEATALAVEDYCRLQKCSTFPLAAWRGLLRR